MGNSNSSCCRNKEIPKTGVIERNDVKEVCTVNDVIEVSPTECYIVDSNPFPIPKSIYFGGCSWGCAFHVGVHKAMVERWGMGYYKNAMITGDSSGAIIAIAIAIGYTPVELENLYKTLADNASVVGVFGKMRSIVQIGLEVLLSNPNTHKELEGRFGLATTTFPFNHRWHWTWKSNADLAECVLGSLHIPLYCESCEPINGSAVIDGAYSFSGEDLLHGDETLYVGIDPHAEIGCSLENNKMLYPLHDAAFEEVAKCGYDAMMSWDGRMKAKVGRRLPDYKMLSFLWGLKLIQFVLVALFRIKNEIFETSRTLLTYKHEVESRESKDVKLS